MDRRWIGHNNGLTLLKGGLTVAFLTASMLAQNAAGQLFENLKAFGNRLAVGDPAVTLPNQKDGPKGIFVADLDGDGHPDIAAADIDGTVTVYFGEGEGKFSSPVYLHTGTNELRGIVCADFSGSGHRDIAVAAPYAGNVYLFLNQGGRNFGAATVLPAWRGARGLIAGDFDGDGKQDLAVAGPQNGLRHYRGTGGGAFDVVTNVMSLDASDPTFPQPYYVLGAFRPTGALHDQVVVTHDETNLISILAVNANGGLEVQGTITNEFAHSLDVGAITQPIASGSLDLVTAQLDLGTVSVHAASNSPARFGQAVGQVINVPGGPRAVKLADLDGDGWNDLVVVLRNFDRVITYHNSNGVLVAASETPVGTSPRELAVGDFNGDGHPDLAVMNRSSQDVSVLLTYPGQAGFSILDQTYPVDGDVAGLSVMDFNHDGRVDVLQLHRSSSELSVRLANPNGSLGPPTFYPMGNLPNQQTVADVNNDGFPDVITVNLGRVGVEQGSLSVRLGRANGSFGPELRSHLPPGVEGRFFAVVAADFDNDGKTDLAVGFFDCRIVFFKGNGDGTFTFTGDHEHLFAYEARGMVAGDFNQDGFIDLAGVGFYGSLVVVQNHEGTIMTAETLDRTEYNPRCCGGSQAGSVRLVDENHDGDPDILISSTLGTTLYLGGPGMTFTLATNTAAALNIPASSFAVADFDGDGLDDLAISCKVLSCITLLTKNAAGEYVPALSVNVPSGGFLATGDLDGDGKPDLIGTGSVLWTALSSHRAQPGPPQTGNSLRPTVAGPVINEVLALNSIFPVDADGGRFSDWLELYNGAPTNFNVLGWRLKLVKAADTNGTNIASTSITNEFTFSTNLVFASGDHIVLICSDKIRSPLHTGFKLPGAGGTVSLINSNGVELDTVQFGQQQQNVSYSRYRDGVASFVSNPFPSAGRANVDNGPLDPVLKFDGLLNGLLPQADAPALFSATGRDDVGIVSVTLVYHRLDIPDPEEHRVIFYDDGMHNDGGILDGKFSGLLAEGLPDGAEIEFYLECIDLTDNTVTVPSDAAFAAPGDPITAYSMVVGGWHPPLEISEVVAGNKTGLHDEGGGTPPWVEIRNCANYPVPLSNFSLAHKYFETGSRLSFTNGQVLAPGEHMVIYCDGKPSQGFSHAPFSLNRGGDELALTSLTTNGASALVDSVAFGPQANDVAYARLGCAGPWIKNTPTPRQENIPGVWMGLVTNGVFTFAFPTATNQTYVVEYANSVSAPIWTALPPIPGDGIEKTVLQPLGNQRFYRVRAH